MWFPVILENTAELRVVCQGMRSAHSLSILDSSGEPAFYRLFSPLPSYSYRTPTLHCMQGESCVAELIQIPENRTFLSLTPLPDGCSLSPSGALNCETERVMSQVTFTIVGLWDEGELAVASQFVFSESSQRAPSQSSQRIPSQSPQQEPLASSESKPSISPFSMTTTQQIRSLSDCQKLRLLSETSDLHSLDCNAATPLDCNAATPLDCNAATPLHCNAATPLNLTTPPPSHPNSLPPLYIPLRLSIARTLLPFPSPSARILPPTSIRLFSDDHEIEDSITLPFACTHSILPSP